MRISKGMPHGPDPCVISLEAWCCNRRGARSDRRPPAERRPDPAADQGLGPRRRATTLPSDGIYGRCRKVVEIDALA
jgi:hypothetical protein